MNLSLKEMTKTDGCVKVEKAIYQSKTCKYLSDVNSVICFSRSLVHEKDSLKNRF